MLAKITESGLNVKDAAKLEFKPLLVPPSGIALKGVGFVVPYHSIIGKLTGFYRYRYLQTVVDPKGKVVRYSQPAGKSPEPYFSPLFPWKQYLKENQAEQRVLFITEGENKANAGAKLEIPVIGLGGVWNFKAKEKELIDGLEQIDWQGATVYIVYDSDAADNLNVNRAEDELAAQLVKRKADVYVVRLPKLEEGKKTGLDDYLLAKGKEAFAQLIDDTAEEWQFSPRIFRNDPLHKAVQKAESLLSMNPEYKLFLRGSELVHIVEEERDLGTQNVFRRPRGNAYLAGMTAANVEFLLSAANCVFAPDGKKGIKRADPKGAWCTQVIQRISGFPEQVPWLRLNMVTNTPLLLEDGSLVDQPGYHAATGVWFDPQGKKFPPIPTQPTKCDARRALELFSQVFGKFPFATEPRQTWDASPAYAAVLATILGVLIRHLLPTVPMLGITAPDPGSGKTKIAEAIGGTTTGCLLPRISYDNTEEFDKHLPSPLRAGDRIILIDNVDSKYVTSARLSEVLSTDAPIKWRILGETRDQVILNRSVFIVTGNHLVISGDLPRRSLLCRLVPNVAAPETRSFAFDPVVRARDMFPELTMAALTALRWYLQAKCPTPQYAKNIAIESGSFEEWNRVVRGLLVSLDFGDPLATQAEARAENPFLESDTELAQALYKLFPRGNEFSASQISRCRGSEAFQLLSPGGQDKWEPQKAGNRLRRLRDRVLDGLKVESAGHLHGVARYRVVTVGGAS